MTRMTREIVAIVMSLTLLTPVGAAAQHGGGGGGHAGGGAHAGGGGGGHPGGGGPAGGGGHPGGGGPAGGGGRPGGGAPRAAAPGAQAPRGGFDLQRDISAPAPRSAPAIRSAPTVRTAPAMRQAPVARQQPMNAGRPAENPNRGRTVVANPRYHAQRPWDWNHGVTWAPAGRYWGGGFWGSFALGAAAVALGAAAFGVLDYDNNQYTSYQVAPDSPGATLLENYGLTQTPCGPPDLVVIFGPDTSVICADPNATVGPGQYDLDPSTLTIVSQ